MVWRKTPNPEPWTPNPGNRNPDALRGSGALGRNRIYLPWSPTGTQAAQKAAKIGSIKVGQNQPQAPSAFSAYFCSRFPHIVYVMKLRLIGPLGDNLPSWLAWCSVRLCVSSRALVRLVLLFFFT